MSACTFFGHRDCPGSVKPRLWEALTELIVNCGVDTFYVGNHGGFDRIVRIVLREPEEMYPNIQYAVVLAHLPGRSSDNTDFSDTILPEGIERIHPRFAISWRNRWMLQQSDYVVAYVIHDWGGAADCVKRAIHSGRTVINIGIMEERTHSKA